MLCWNMWVQGLVNRAEGRRLMHLACWSGMDYVQLGLAIVVLALALTAYTKFVIVPGLKRLT